MPPEEWNRMMEEFNRAWAEHQEVADRITQSLLRSGIPDDRDLDRANTLWEKVQAIRKQQQDYLDKTFGPE